MLKIESVNIKKFKDCIEKAKFSVEVPDYEDDNQIGTVSVDVIKVSDVDKYIKEASEDVRVKDIKDCVRSIQDFLMTQCSSVVEDHRGVGEIQFGYCTEELDEFLKNILNSV